VSVLPIAAVGHPVLRERAREVTDDELRSPAVQRLIDDMIETMRSASGAGLAANQVHDLHRIAVVEVREGNQRYPYKPPIPLTVMVNPELEPLGDETIEVNEGCLSVPDLRGALDRFAAVRVRYRDRDGRERVEERRGLSAGTFQHEVDHLDGVLFLDRVRDPATFSTWEQFDRHHRERFVAHAEALVERYGS
jgi:peptide deformylase